MFFVNDHSKIIDHQFSAEFLIAEYKHILHQQDVQVKVFDINDIILADLSSDGVVEKVFDGGEFGSWCYKISGI